MRSKEDLLPGPLRIDSEVFEHDDSGHRVEQQSSHAEVR